MGLLDKLVFALIGAVQIGRQERKMEERTKRRNQWLVDNKYNIERQLEINRWCQENCESIIEEVYGHPYRTIEWEKVYRLRGSLPVRKELCRYFCKKEGINYFDFDHPPKEYKEIQ